MRRCEECGKLIPTARIAAVPDTTLCVACKSEHDDRPLRARDLGEGLATPGEITPSESQQMTQRGG